MKKLAKTLEFKFERTIPAPATEVYDAWLDPKIPGNLWNFADKLILNPKVDGVYYAFAGETPHYGRFTQADRPARLQHTWVSPHTLGQESLVTVTFKKQGDETLMTLVHSDLPDTDGGRRHKDGWNYFLDTFQNQFGKKSSKNK